MTIQKRLATQAIAAVGLLAASSIAQAQNWVTQADMVVARVEATTVDYRDDIYVFNGFRPGIKIANSVEKYDAATKQWSIISATSTSDGTAVTHNGVVRIGADVWIIGGRIGSHPGRVSDDVWIYNLDNGNWRRGPELPVPGAAGGAALVDNKIHWFGGIDPDARCDVARHLVHDLGSPASGWQDITAKAGMPSPRNHFSTAVVDGIIYAMGGQYGHDGCPGKNTQDTPLVHAFDPKTNNWSRKSDMPNKNSHSEPGTFVYKGDIYTTGGENAKNKVWKYDPRADSWSTFRTLSDELVAPIARIIDGHLIVAGGGAPIAQNATDTVRSMLVDNNPPAPEPIPVAQPLPGSDTPAGPTLISMEAEYFDVSTLTSTHQWVNVAIGDSSNDAAMTTTPDQGDLAESTENTPMLSYMVYFNHPGKHYIWVRGLGDSNESGIGNSDSLHIGLNGSVASTAYRIDQFPAQWTWSRHTPGNPVASLNVVDAGVNMINFWMREDGLAIDKFIVTSDPDFVPEGYGPEVTDGSDGYIPPVSDANTSDNIANDTDASATQVDADATASGEVGNNPAMSTTENDTSSEPGATDSGTDTDTDIDIDIDTDGIIPASDQASSGTTINAGTSGGGVFGGGASGLSVLALLALCVVRIAPSRRTRLA